jgi:hypothetical protein
MMEEAELTYVVDAEGLSTDVTCMSATRLIRLDTPKAGSLQYTV